MNEKINTRSVLSGKFGEIVEAVKHSDQPGKFYDWFDIFILSLIFKKIVRNVGKKLIQISRQKHKRTQRFYKIA